MDKGKQKQGQGMLVVVRQFHHYKACESLCEFNFYFVMHSNSYAG